MLFSVLCWFMMLGALAATPPSEAPILRVEVGMHTAAIRALAVEASNKRLVTASIDKTARVWDLETGELLLVLRPPIGEGREGELYAVACSPDGVTVAVAGWASLGGEPGSNGIWLFNLQDGKLLGRLGQLPDAVLSLAFSHDGARLAAGLGGAHGVRVFDMKRHSELPLPEGFAADSTYSVEFDARGRLLTASFDGHLRLFDARLALTDEVNTGQGRRPYTARFSPDGASVAVGYYDEAVVERRSGRTLQLRTVHADRRAAGGSLGNVVWSADGSRVCAGGTVRDEGGFNQLRCWGEARARGEYPAGRNTILALGALADGGFVIATHEPRWLAVDKQGLPRLNQASPTLNFTDEAMALYADSSGARVSFGAKKPDSPMLLFSASNGQLTSDGGGAGLTLPVQEHPALMIGDWRNGVNPSLEGRSLDGLTAFEHSRSMAIQPDGDRFVIGSDFRIHLYDSVGRLRASSAELPGAAWALTWSGDGRLVIAAVGDGTIRWFRGDTLRPLLTLYVHPDRRWIAWTPSGYYRASTSGDGLAVWHRNRGSGQEASVSELARFRTRYYRADVIEAVLSTMDEHTAINAPLCHLLPPSVDVELDGDTLRHAGAQRELHVLVRRACEQAPAAEGLELRLNSRAFITLRGDDLERSSEPVLGDPLTLRVTVQLKGLPEVNSKLTVFAYSDVAGEPEYVTLIWEGVKRSLLPRLFVLAVGVEDPHRGLNSPDEDAKRFADFWRKNAAASYAPNPNIRVLTNKSATARAVLEALEETKREADRNTDVVMIFLAGHAQPHPEYSDFMFKAGGAQEGHYFDYLEGQHLSRVLARIAGKVVLFLDTCAAGGVGPVARARGDSVDFANALHSVENGVIVFAGSASSGVSLESQAWGGGVFTQAVLLGLEGGAASSNGHVNLTDLESFVQDYVLRETKNAQLPRVLWPPHEGSGGSFPIHTVPRP